MLASINQNPLPIDKSTKATHILVILPKLERLPKKYEIPGRQLLKKILDRKQIKFNNINESPLCATLDNGALCVWAMIDLNSSVFTQQTYIRTALQLLLTENPKEIHIAVFGSNNQKQMLANLSVYSAWVNGAALPDRKKTPTRESLSSISLYGHKDPKDYALLHAQAEGNLLARGLTVLPANELTPGSYREQIKKLAANENWDFKEYDLDTLRKIGAGAFVAVSQGGDPDDGAIIHLQRRVSNDRSNKTIALVGKGICFDTGGYNLKSPRNMHGMHKDMNGSAVALGIMLAATRANLPANLDCWLAITQNHISSRAFKQNDVVTALNGLTIEIIHTDAEGRMILADTLTMAERNKPDMIIDFATLTGSMHTALGSRYSGIFSNKENLLHKAVTAGKSSGERVCIFPLDSDYDEYLQSTIADIKQCTLDNEFDHILAARFLNRFVNNVPWIHMDLSACNHKDGLGAVNTNITGFGVSWAIQLLRELSSN